MSELIRIADRLAENKTEYGQREAFRLYVWEQTPQSVWDEYRANGYSIQEAIQSEMSYA